MWRLIRVISTLLPFDHPRFRDIDRRSVMLAGVSQSSLSTKIETHGHVRRSDNICGSLASSYPGVAAPSCVGQFSLCTFVDLMQGCCNDQNVCQFYTTCYDHEEITSSKTACDSSSCLICHSASPSCTEYRLIDEQNRGNWLGYACGALPTTVFAIALSDEDGERTQTQVANTVQAATTGASTHADASTSRPTSALTLSTTMHSTTSGSQAATRTSTASGSSSGTSTSLPASSGPSGAKVGGIAAGVIVAIVLLAIISGLIYYHVQKKRRRRQAEIEALNVRPPVDDRPLMGNTMPARGEPYYVHGDERGQF